MTWLPDATPRPRRLAVGEFDGVHVGHREVIDGADTGARAAHGQQIEVPEAPAGAEVLLVDPDGPVALAEPRADGRYAPIVGFRAQ